jgi:PPP family 3-phenylpropionic acid transporter
MTAEPIVRTRKLTSQWGGSLYYLVTFLGAGASAPFLYVYFTDIGLSGQQVGWLSSLGPILTMLLSTAVASFADRRRWRIPILQSALLVTAVVFFLMRFPTTFINIALLMFFYAVFSSPIMTIAEGLIARMAHRNNLNYGSMRLWGSLGYAVSALGFGLLWQVLGLRSLFVAGALFYLPLIFLAGQLEEGPIIPKQERRPISELLHDRGLFLILGATFLAAISNSLSMTFSGILARSLGGGDFLIGAIIGFSAFAELPMMFFSDRISARISKKNAALLSYGLMSVSFLGYVLVKNPALLPIIAILKGFGYGLWITVTIRMVTERTPEEWASTSQSLLTICLFGLAPIVAGPVGGWIHDVINPGAVFGLGIIALALAGVVLMSIGKTDRIN